MEFKKTFTKDYKNFRYYIDNKSVSSEKFYDWIYICQLRCQLNKMTYQGFCNQTNKQGRKVEIEKYEII